MKSLMVHGIFILYCCVFTNCFPIEEELTLGHSKDIWEMKERDNYDPECDSQIDDKDIEETTTNKQHLNPGTKSEMEDYRTTRLESVNNFSKEGVTDSMEGMATTSIPVTSKPHGWLIFPGTKWCGDGSTATSDDDLGPKEEEDKCCRKHDFCEDYILPGETKYNLTNNSSYSSTSCQCDNELYECLKQANTSTSHFIGSLYFNFVGKNCFGLNYPRICKKYIPLIRLCYEYEVDTSAEKIYQWISPKKYKTQ